MALASGFWRSRSCQVVQVARVGRKRWGSGRPEQPFPQAAGSVGTVPHSPRVVQGGRALRASAVPRSASSCSLLAARTSCLSFCSHARSVPVNAIRPNVTSPRTPEHQPGLSCGLRHQGWPPLRPLAVPAGPHAGCEMAAPAFLLLPNVAAPPLLPSPAQSSSPSRLNSRPEISGHCVPCSAFARSPH